MAAVEFEDPLGDVVQEVAVVGDRDDGARIAAQMLLEPLHALGVEVVGRLVQQQQVRTLQQQPAQRNSAAFAAGQRGDVGVGGRTAQRVHGLLQPGVEIPGVALIQLLLQRTHFGEQLVAVVLGKAG